MNWVPASGKATCARGVELLGDTAHLGGILRSEISSILFGSSPVQGEPPRFEHRARDLEPHDGAPGFQTGLCGSRFSPRPATAGAPTHRVRERTHEGFSFEPDFLGACPHAMAHGCFGTSPSALPAPRAHLSQPPMKSQILVLRARVSTLAAILLLAAVTASASAAPGARLDPAAQRQLTATCLSLPLRLEGDHGQEAATLISWREAVATLCV